MAAPIRVLTAVPICDGHDSAINTINLEFIRHGIEVVYLGFHRYVGDIVRAAIQEDVAAIGISSYNGGHIEFFAEVVRQLRKLWQSLLSFGQQNRRIIYMRPVIGDAGGGSSMTRKFGRKLSFVYSTTSGLQPCTSASTS